jgi:hypothetical protein
MYSLYKIALSRPPLNHLRIIRNIIINYYNTCSFSKYEAIHETLFDPADVDGLVIDLIFLNVETRKPEIALVVISDKQIHSEYQMLIASHLQHDYDFLEVFAYNNESKDWYCFGKDVDKSSPSFSKILQIDFAEMIHL